MISIFPHLSSQRFYQFLYVVARVNLLVLPSSLQCSSHVVFLVLPTSFLPCALVLILTCYTYFLHRSSSLVTHVFSLLPSLLYVLLCIHGVLLVLLILSLCSLLCASYWFSSICPPFVFSIVFQLGSPFFTTVTSFLSPWCFSLLSLVFLPVSPLCFPLFLPVSLCVPPLFPFASPWSLPWSLPV